MTLSTSTKAFCLLNKKALTVPSQEQSVLVPIANTMLRKLGAYERLLCSDLEKLATICDPRFPNYVISDFYLLRICIRLPEQKGRDDTTNRGDEIIHPHHCWGRCLTKIVSSAWKRTTSVSLLEKSRSQIGASAPYNGGERMRSGTPQFPHLLEVY